MNNYNKKQRGGWINDSNIYRGTLIQKGYGLGGLFKRFFKWVTPILKKHALPKLQEGVKVLGQEALSSAGDIIKDVYVGKNLKESAKSRLDTAVNNIKDKVEAEFPTEQSGSGIKRKKRFKKYLIYKNKNSKRQKSNDIFD